MTNTSIDLPIYCPVPVCLKEAVINEMHNPSEIATKGINTAKILATRYMRVVQAFRDLQKAPKFY